MTIKFPLSFCLMLAAILVTSALSVTFGHVNLIGLIFGIALIIGLRFAAHWETRRAMRREGAM